LPFLNELVDAIHRMVAAPKQAGGITFSNEHVNIIIDDYDADVETQ